MPVELTSFTAEFDGRAVTLNWSTATEIINYGFEVQRSTQTDEWEILGFVEGHGNSYSPKYYEFVDDLATLPNLKMIEDLKYRLKQMDLDGMFEYLGKEQALRGLVALPKCDRLFLLERGAAERLVTPSLGYVTFDSDFRYSWLLLKWGSEPNLGFTRASILL